MRKTITWLLMLAAGATLLYAATYRQNLSNAGMQFGTSRSDKIGFWAATPVTQQVVSVAGLTNTGAYDVGVLSNVVQALRACGLVRTN
jgi:hypothetical protein